MAPWALPASENVGQCDHRPPSQEEAERDHLGGRGESAGQAPAPAPECPAVGGPPQRTETLAPAQRTVRRPRDQWDRADGGGGGGGTVCRHSQGPGALEAGHSDVRSVSCSGVRGTRARTWAPTAADFRAGSGGGVCLWARPLPDFPTRVPSHCSGASQPPRPQQPLSRTLHARSKGLGEPRDGRASLVCPLRAVRGTPGHGGRAGDGGPGELPRPDRPAPVRVSSQQCGGGGHGAQGSLGVTEVSLSWCWSPP